MKPLIIPFLIFEAVLAAFAIFGVISLHQLSEKPSLPQIDSIVIMDKTGVITHQVNSVHVWDVQTGQVFGTKNYIVEGEVTTINNPPPNGQ